MIYDEHGARFELGNKLGQGGQGVVWRLKGQPLHLVKIYHDQPSHRDFAKHSILKEKSGSLSHYAALPVSLAFRDTAKKNHVGVFIPYVEGRSIFELYGTSSRVELFPQASFQFLVRVACNVATVFERLHQNEIVIGDVNEQNIIVLRDATVRLIDTDSFQVRDKLEVYTSDVGTPLWTAPELHGKDLTGCIRTKNHDLFSLAQLVFLILFVGRNPFAGVPKTSRHLTPEEAIRQHAYAYAGTEFNMPLVPPPGTPKIESLPHNLRDAFVKAFMKDSIKEGARPTATTWRTMLEDFSKQLVPCNAGAKHYHWKHFQPCPWCTIIKQAGVDLFPSPKTRRLGGENDDYQIVQLLGQRPHQFSISVVTKTIGLKPSPLPPPPTGFLSSFTKFWAPQLWRRQWINSLIKDREKSIQSAVEEIAALIENERQAIASYKKDFSTYFLILEKTVSELRNTNRLREKSLSQVVGDRRERALHEHLQRFRVSEHKISQIGDVRSNTLASRKIYTAADITAEAIAKCYFPHQAAANLFGWRLSKEKTFHFDEKKWLSSLELQQIEHKVSELKSELRQKALSADSKLSDVLRSTKHKLSLLNSSVVAVSKRKDQAEEDLRAFQAELLKW
jgi:hypothetical protein